MITNQDKKQVFGFASMAQITDLQGDTIDTDTLEQAAYNFIREGVGGEMHQKIGGAHLIESMFITADKAAALGINKEHVGKWYVGFQVHDDTLWEKIKDGKYKMFSIGGKARSAGQ